MRFLQNIDCPRRRKYCHGNINRLLQVLLLEEDAFLQSRRRVSVARAIFVGS